MAITQVCATVSGTANNGGDVTLTLPTAASGDVVILIGGRSNPHSVDPGVPPANCGPATAGYTTILSDHTRVEATDSVTIGAWYKVMGGTPDASVVGNGDGSSANGTAYHAIVLRGVDTASVVDVVSAIARHGGTGAPDPPSVTVATAGAWVFAVGAASVGDSTATAPTGYTGLAWSSFSETNPIANGFAYKEAASAGAEDPGAFTDVTSGNNPGGFTFAIKPAGGAVEPAEGAGTGTLTFVGSGAGSRSAAGSGSGTLAFVGAGAAARDSIAAGSGTLAFTSAGVGSAPSVDSADGAGAGTLTFTGTGSGSRDSHGTGSGTLALVGTGAGSAPSVDRASGAGSGSLAFVGSGAGSRPSTGAGSGSLVLTGSGIGSRSSHGSGSGTLTFVSVGRGGGVRDIVVVSIETRSRNVTITTRQRAVTTEHRQRTVTFEERT